MLYPNNNVEHKSNDFLDIINIKFFLYPTKGHEFNCITRTENIFSTRSSVSLAEMCSQDLISLNVKAQLSLIREAYQLSNFIRVQRKGYKKSTDVLYGKVRTYCRVLHEFLGYHTNSNQWLKFHRFFCTKPHETCNIEAS